MGCVASCLLPQPRRSVPCSETEEAQIVIWLQQLDALEGTGLADAKELTEIRREFRLAGWTKKENVWSKQC